MTLSLNKLLQLSLFLLTAHSHLLLELSVLDEHMKGCKSQNKAGVLSAPHLKITLQAVPFQLVS